MADAVGGAAKVNGHANGYPSSYAAKYNLASHFIGGNALNKAPPTKVKDFVQAHDGHTVITNVRLNPHSSFQWRQICEMQSYTARNPLLGKFLPAERGADGQHRS